MIDWGLAILLAFLAVPAIVVMVGLWRRLTGAALPWLPRSGWRELSWDEIREIGLAPQFDYEVYELRWRRFSVYLTLSAKGARYD